MILRHFLDEVVQHHFGDFKIGDHAVAKGPDRLNVAGGSAEHLARFFADGDRTVRADVLGDDRRLA